MDNTLVKELADFIVLNKEIGYIQAHIEWIHCFDDNNTSRKYKKLTRQQNDINKKIIKLRKQITTKTTEVELNSLLTEADTQRKEYQEHTETEIEKSHRPPNFTHNKSALITLTKTEIPEDIKIALGFGYKFLFPYACNNQNMHKILAQLEMTIDTTIPELKKLEVCTDISRILRHKDKFQNDNNIRWLKFINHRTQTFLKNNPKTFATKSDKGGHTVIIDENDYEEKLKELLKDKSYAETKQTPLRKLIKKEQKLVDDLNKINTLNELIQKIPPFEPQTLQLPSFYGLPKIHKAGSPLRPITATINSTGYFTAKLFSLLLKEVFPITDYHIQNTYQFTQFIQNVKLKDNDILVSFDVVSMYTSIPLDLVKEIIYEKLDDFHLHFSLKEKTIKSILHFLLHECNFFTALDKTYKQLDGLPMGSCISPLIARIVMDKVIAQLLKENPDISFIKVYVDDTVAAIHKDKIEMALNTLNNFRKGQIRFTKELEADRKLNFLNITLHRQNNSIDTKWYRKSFASGRLVNYFSSHKRTTIIGTAIQFIKTVLTLSNARFFNENRDIVTNTLRENAFPETTIINLMNTHYTYMKPLFKEKIEKGEENEIEYVIFPHSICKSREIKRIIHNNKSQDQILADSTRNTKINSITTRKTKIPIDRKKNLILISKCTCGQKYKIVKSKFNETGKIAKKIMLTKRSQCDKASHAYKKVKFQRGLWYGSQTSYLLKYIQWKHRNELDMIDCKFEFPNHILRKLIK